MTNSSTSAVPVLTTITENQWAVPAGNMGRLTKRVERFARKSAKLGLAPMGIKVVGEYTKRVIVGGHEYFDVYSVVEVFGQAPTINGHKMVARVEHTEAGNIVSVVSGSGFTTTKAIRKGKAVCDHCKTNRARKDTFIVKTPAGMFMRCGRTCLADFLRSDDAVNSLLIFNILWEVQGASKDADGYEEGGASRSPEMSLERYLSFVAQAIEVDGWVPRSRGTDYNTADAAAMRMSKNLLLTDKQTQDAKDAILWARAISEDTTSDYLQNLKVVCSLDYVRFRNMGLAASAVSAMRRDKAQKIEAAKTANRPNKHFGEAGQRWARKLTMTRLSTWENDFGVTFLYSFLDEDGNTLKWRTSDSCWVGGEPIEQGKDYWFVFGIKKHGEWKGNKETHITRCKGSVDQPTIKWSSPAGQIFKTKKALTAAA